MPSAVVSSCMWLLVECAAFLLANHVDSLSKILTVCQKHCYRARVVRHPATRVASCGGSVVRSRVKALLCGATALGCALWLVAVVPATAAKETPKATEIGVTADTIRIAVVADVDNPFSPGLFQGVVDGVQAR